MSPLSQLARSLLIVHGLMNVAMGAYSIADPQAYIATTGDMFVGSTDKAIRSIGLGAFGVGWYQLVFALQGNRTMYLSTIPMRLFFTTVMGTYWGWDHAAVGYELVVAFVAAVAAFQSCVLYAVFERFDNLFQPNATVSEALRGPLV